MSVIKQTTEVLDILNENARDSVAHALYHALDLAGASSAEFNKSSWHHIKWFIISIHHAATMALIIEEAKKNNTKLNQWICDNYFPPLSKLLDIVICEEDDLSNDARIFLKNLNNERNKVYHKQPDQLLSARNAVASLICLLHYFQVKGLTLINTDREHLQAMTFLLRGNEHNEIQSFIERLLRHKYNYGSYAKTCEFCGTEAIYEQERYCQACYYNYSLEECETCAWEYPVTQVGNQNYPDSCSYCAENIQRK